MRSYTAFLRIRHPAIDPAAITQELGLEPAHAWAAGSAREATGGGTARGEHPDTYWIAELGRSGWEIAAFHTGGRPFAWPKGRALPLELFLFAQLRALQPKREFLNRLVAEGGQLVIGLTLGEEPDEALELSAGLMRAFGELGIGLSIEAGAEGDEENELSS